MTEKICLDEEAREFFGHLLMSRGDNLVENDPELLDILSCFAYDVVHSVDLDDRTRYLAWLSTIIGCMGPDSFRSVAVCSLENALTPVELKELVYQSVAFLGISRALPFVRATNAVLERLEVEVPLPKQATIDHAHSLEAGEQVLVDIFGEQMRGFSKTGNPDYPNINKWLTGNCFGQYYTRGGLSLADRELIAFCLIAGQGGCEAQLKTHIVGNLAVGNSRELLIKVVNSNLPLLGYPRTQNTLTIIDVVQAEIEMQEQQERLESQLNAQQ
ncbi:MAG: carboxymuconolactone decarboxylase family protein [Atopobiaceae bacterium]|nr:carboxymuconolactone decarboxylase family protein [Atopobiaceae bacterium]